MKNYLKLMFTLFVITSLATLFVTLTYSVTQGPIERKQIEDRNNAMLSLLPNCDSFKSISVDKKYSPSSDKIKITSVDIGYKNDTTTGYIITSVTKGYGGDIVLLTAIDITKSTVSGIEILSLSETPGLGANATNPEFKDQFKEIPSFSKINVVKNGSSEISDSSEDDTSGASKKNPESDTYDVNAITGATITTSAISSAVNDSLSYFNDFLKGGN